MVCIAWVVALEPSSAAQEPAPDLRALKTQLRRDLLSALLPEMKTHREDLLALERKLATAQDFAGASRARDERLKIEGEISSMEKELPLVTARASGAASARAPERIEFKLSDAHLTGLQFDPKDNALTGFGGPEAGATWTLPGIPPGGYEVVLRSTGGSGNAVLKENFYELTAPIKESKDKPVEQTLGTLRIRDGRSTLSLSANPPEKCAGLRVYSLVLVPSAL